MNKKIVIVRTFFAYFVIGIVGFICLFPCLLIACLPVRYRRDNRLFFLVSYIFFKTIVWAIHIPLTVKGRENIVFPAIIAPNHLSSLDIPLVGSLLGTSPHMWLFLSYYEQIPLFGFITKRMNIPIDTASPRLLMGALKHAITLGKEHKRHLIIFPEGGRARQGTLLKFFSGFAILAEKTGLPVVPIRMYNPDKVFPPGAFWIHNYPLTIIIGKPMYMHEGESNDAFVDRVRAWFDNPVAE